ncbi:kinase-like protein [Pleomassaria siparia CBS 279.74]|uniref:non-specific serine/threonine protein kinase n=1 Tax=Pleomassaria siparia CBS 279.74 TaxID=1314801 RepID=A0A6G1JT23_9PLEO|nr:kinase-like protein [Pleomassaria siparia CBS 279.74]
MPRAYIEGRMLPDGRTAYPRLVIVNQSSLQPQPQPQARARAPPARPPPAVPDPLPLSNLPYRYKVVGDVGMRGLGGGNSGILQVRKRSTGRVYVEKKLKPDHIQKGWAHDEVKILKFLGGKSNADSIVKLKDSFIDEQRLFGSIIFEHCTWGSCTDLINRHRPHEQYISEAWLWKAFRQLDDAIQCLHARSALILHLDLKPSNILLVAGTNGPDIKVADFGTARSLDLHVEGANIWTPCYAPPERTSHSNGLEKSTDVWGIGIIVLCLAKLSNTTPAIRDPGQLYTTELFDAIYACLRNQPFNRVESRNLTALLGPKHRMASSKWNRGVDPIGPRH